VRHYTAFFPFPQTNTRYWVKKLRLLDKG
jgi:hypothetical protein